MPNLTGRQLRKTSGWDVPSRDLGIILGGFVLGLVVLITPFTSIFIRIVLFAAILGSAVIYAFWRVEKAWTIEQYILQKLGFSNRSHLYRKGGGLMSSVHAYARADLSENAAAVTLPFRGPQDNDELFFTVLSLFLFTVLLAWLGTGGVDEMILFLRALGSAAGLAL
jgi:hypothetical protein